MAQANPHVLSGLKHDILSGCISMLQYRHAKLSQDSMSVFLCDSIHGNICWHSLFLWLQGRTVSFVSFAQCTAL